MSEHHCPAASFTTTTTVKESQGFLHTRNSGFVYSYWSSATWPILVRLKKKKSVTTPLKPYNKQIFVSHPNSLCF